MHLNYNYARPVLSVLEHLKDSVNIHVSFLIYQSPCCFSHLECINISVNEKNDNSD